jgi:hypothetical protein
LLLPLSSNIVVPTISSRRELQCISHSKNLDVGGKQCL